MIKLKYKGKNYKVIESQLSLKGLPGIREVINGVTLIILYNSLKGYKRNLEIHRLITGRGLRDIRPKI